MNEKDVVDLLKKVESIGVDMWITGGWGVDALIGHQTRPHNDIDIFIQKKDALAFKKMLNSNGYFETKIESEDQTVWSNTCNCTIDIHLFEFTEAEALRFENEIYPFSILNGKGKIGGISVRCMPVEAQVKYHQNYEIRQKDIDDVLLLCKTFGLPIPENYIAYTTNIK